MSNDKGIKIYQNIHDVRQAYPCAIISGRGRGNVLDDNCLAFIKESHRLQPYYQTLDQHADQRLVQRQLIENMEQQGRVFIRRNDDGTFQSLTDEEKLLKAQKRLYVRPSMRNNNVLLPSPSPPPQPLGLQPKLLEPPPLPLVPHPPHVLPPDVPLYPDSDSEVDDLISLSTISWIMMICDDPLLPVPPPPPPPPPLVLSPPPIQIQVPMVPQMEDDDDSVLSFI